MGKHKPILIHPTGCTSNSEWTRYSTQRKFIQLSARWLIPPANLGKLINPVKPKRKTKWLGIVAVVHLHTLTPRATREAFE